ncbi:MAG: PocR ligand-binding domain-containing protein [Bacillota bacterium]|jgi:ligand-binding sensor protein/AraC-like DNA-binding protein|nr:PocR ligand-binding domain-containing protein [Bacillota bacterium]HHU43930.1 helix-turn-helix domain-containing protein [Clostridiales bacterium]
MSERSLLLKLFEAGDFQKLQDKVALATNIAMITVDFTGRPVSKHSCCNEFCSRVRSDEVLSEYCQKCDSRGGLEAARLSRPYIYICHMGLVDFAIPVVLNGTYVGAVMAGQIRLKGEAGELERVTNIQNEHKIEGALKSLYEALPSMTLDRIKSLSDMVSYLYNYFIKEASEKLTFSKPPAELASHKKAPILQKAIDYINDNFNKEIRLETLAAICEISPSYFSKLFKKIYRQNLSSFVNSLRVQRAKSLLANSNKNIVDIAYDVGFEDCGYFIKIFKSFVGVTPNQYRISLEA